jgi:RimJ/RimL family protein N-acetyltransferase
MQFETQRFLLRSLTPLDASPKLSEWALDALGAEMLNQPPRLWPLEHQRHFFAASAAAPGQILLGFWEKSTKQLIGFFVIEPHPKSMTYLLTTLVGEKQWRGNWVIAEVSEPVHNYFFNTLGFAKAKANVRPHNRAMLWLMANGGWKKEAQLVQHLREPGTGKRVDVLVIGLLAEDWRKYMQKTAKAPWRELFKGKGPD